MSTKPATTTDEQALSVLLPDPASRDAVEARTTALMIRNALLGAIESQRDRTGMTKRDLADGADLDYAALRRLLTADDANPTLDTVARLLAVTHLQMQLVADDGEIFAIPGWDRVPA